VAGINDLNQLNARVSLLIFVHWIFIEWIVEDITRLEKKDRERLNDVALSINM
jgi:hypothetical protein